jgi:hypothetical protein
MFVLLKHMNGSVAIALMLVAPACFAGPIDEQQMVGHWKTREKIDLVLRRNISSR